MNAFSQNPAYREFQVLLIRLNWLMAAGASESIEAEAIRDRMDVLDRELRPAERERLNGLSADLFMLQDDEIFEPLSEGETQIDLQAELAKAWREKRMETLLCLLRKGPAFLNREGVASVRSYAYKVLGDLEPALLFKQLAERLNPSEAGHSLGVLEILYALGRQNEAQGKAWQVLHHPSATAGMRDVAFRFLTESASPHPEPIEANNFATARQALADQNAHLLQAA